MRALRYRAVQLGYEIRFGDGLAQLLASPCEGEGCRDRRYGFWHGANCDFLPSMRRSSRPRLRRWSPANQLTLLHELCRHAFREIRMNRRFVHNGPRNNEVWVAPGQDLGRRPGAGGPILVRQVTQVDDPTFLCPIRIAMFVWSIPNVHVPLSSFVRILERMARECPKPRDPAAC